MHQYISTFVIPQLCAIIVVYTTSIYFTNSTMQHYNFVLNYHMIFKRLKHDGHTNTHRVNLHYLQTSYLQIRLLVKIHLLPQSQYQWYLVNMCRYAQSRQKNVSHTWPQQRWTRRHPALLLQLSYYKQILFMVYVMPPFSHYCLMISLFKMAPKDNAEVSSSVPKYKRLTCTLWRNVCCELC